ncbi:hypothetical protein HKD37_02G005308 [Glycine soja]
MGNITYEFGIYFCHVPVNEQVNEVVNDNGTLEVDEVYVSDEDVTYQQLSEDSSSEYNPIGEDANLSDVDDLSDFDEIVGVIGIVHSNSGMDEIYEERGLNSNSVVAATEDVQAENTSAAQNEIVEVGHPNTQPIQIYFENMNICSIVAKENFINCTGDI